jgi:hypothetical protein
MPDWQAIYSDIAGSEPVAMRMTAANGLRLRTGLPNGWVIFWTTSGVETFLARLESVGVPVSNTPVRIGFWTGINV